VVDTVDDDVVVAVNDVVQSVNISKKKSTHLLPELRLNQRQNKRHQL